MYADVNKSKSIIYCNHLQPSCN